MPQICSHILDHYDWGESWVRGHWCSGGAELIIWLSCLVFFRSWKCKNWYYHSFTFTCEMYLLRSLLPYKIKASSCLMFSDLLVCSWAVFSPVSSVFLKVCFPIDTAQAYVNSLKYMTHCRPPLKKFYCIFSCIFKGPMLVLSSNFI